MKIIIRKFYEEPVVCLAVIQAIATGLAATEVIAMWIPAVTLLVVAGLQRQLVRPEWELEEWEREA